MRRPTAWGSSAAPRSWRCCGAGCSRSATRAVAVLGFGGIGKTSLAAKLARDVAPSFERVYWRSLRNAPPVAEWLAGAIGFLSDQQVVPPPSEVGTDHGAGAGTSRQALPAGRSTTRRRCSRRPSGRAAIERALRGTVGYCRRVAETSHQSCLLLTSREAPPELAVLGGGRTRARAARPRHARGSGVVGR